VQGIDALHIKITQTYLGVTVLHVSTSLSLAKFTRPAKMKQDFNCRTSFMISIKIQILKLDC